MPSTATTLARAVPRRIIRTSVVALTIVAAMIVAVFVVKDRSARQQASYAQAVSTVDHLRVQVQRSALLAADLIGRAGAEQPYLLQQLLAVVHDIRVEHGAMVGGSAVQGLPLELRRAYAAAPLRLDRSVARHMETLSGLATGDTARVRWAIETAGSGLDHALAQLAREFRANQLRELGRYERWETGLIGATLVVVALQVVFVFRPTALLVHDAFDDLMTVHEAHRCQALTDDLTGLGNRKALMRRLKQRTDGPCILLRIDLDNFKTVNDMFGHDSGDRVLQAVGREMRGLAGPGDLGVRLGGDEFALLLADAPSQQRAYEVAEVLVRQVEVACPEAVSKAGLAVSIGIAAADACRDRLLQDADVALYEAKSSTSQPVCFYDSGMRKPIDTRQAVETAFRAGLARSEFLLYFQPQIDLATGRPIGLEALARWQRAPGDVLGAGAFIPYIEDGPLMLEAGHQAVDLALAFQREVRSRGLDCGPIGLNIADLQLRQPDFAETLLRRIEAAGLWPPDVSVEVVERAFVGRGQDLIGLQLESLAAAGIGVELDDFGTGHASLTHLKTFPVGRIKIDRSFVSGIGTDRGDETIVRATVDIARSFGKRVIAEGIETPAQRAFLLQHGCIEGQGYLIAPPLPAELAIDWLRKQHAAADARATMSVAAS
ncbi:MAG: EAL domain-containing protein [Pseudomonadota bacterium]